MNTYDFLINKPIKFRNLGLHFRVFLTPPGYIQIHILFLYIEKNQFKGEVPPQNLDIRFIVTKKSSY